MKKNALQKIEPTNVIDLPGSAVNVTPKVDSMDFSRAEETDIQKVGRELGIPNLTANKYKAYRKFGMSIRRLGIANIGKATLIEVQQGIQGQIKYINKMLGLCETVAAIEDNKENNATKEKLFSQKRDLLKDLKDVAVKIIEAAQADGTAMEQAPANRAFSSGTPVILAQNATFNQQPQRKD